MLKRDLIGKVSQRLEGYLKKDITQAVELVLHAIGESLSAGRRVEIRGFGSFSVRQRQARATKNPKTGQIMAIPPRNTLLFTMSKSLKDSLIQKETIQLEEV